MPIDHHKTQTPRPAALSRPQDGQNDTRNKWPGLFGRIRDRVLAIAEPKADAAKTQPTQTTHKVFVFQRNSVSVGIMLPLPRDLD